MGIMREHIDPHWLHAQCLPNKEVGCLPPMSYLRKCLKEKKFLLICLLVAANINSLFWKAGVRH